MKKTEIIKVVTNSAGLITSAIAIYKSNKDRKYNKRLNIIFIFSILLSAYFSKNVLDELLLPEEEGEDIIDPE